MANTTNIVIDQGTTYRANVPYLYANGDAVTVNGSFSANAQMRKHHQSNTAVAFTATLSNGIVTVVMAANSTANLDPGHYVWDLRVTTANADVQRVTEGLVSLRASVTR